MTNTIPNVPRDLLERVLYLMDNYIGTTHPEEDEIRAILSAPSPAGVDGLEVATFLHTLHMELGQTEQFCSKWKGDPFGVSGVDYSSTYSVTSEPLCRLSDAQAIIDGLRGEVERSKQFAAGHVLTNGRISASLHAVEAERDQQAKRIGELEGLLREVRLPDDIGRMDIWTRIDAALSAGKEWE